MIEPFCSVYKKSYRWFGKDPEDEVAKPCLYFSELKENFRPLEDSKAIYNPERDEAVIKDLHLKRLMTTYQKYHCSSVGKKSLVIDPDDLDADEFMVYFNNYFRTKTQALLPPVYTGRRVFGYSRFENYYTGKTTYDDEISREAYEYFKRDYDKGLSRLFRKKQEALHKLREEAKEEAIKEAEEEEEAAKKKKEEEEEDEDKKKESSSSSSSSSVRKESNVKEKICRICCEKYGDFSYKVPSKNSLKSHSKTSQKSVEKE